MASITRVLLNIIIVLLKTGVFQIRRDKIQHKNIMKV